MAKISYTVEMAKKLRELKSPVKGLQVDVRARPNYLAITVYESNIMEYNESQREQVMNHLLLMRQLILSYGTPCEIEGMKHTDEQIQRRRSF